MSNKKRKSNTKVRNNKKTEELPKAVTRMNNEKNSQKKNNSSHLATNKNKKKTPKQIRKEQNRKNKNRSNTKPTSQKTEKGNTVNLKKEFEKEKVYKDKAIESQKESQKENSKELIQRKDAKKKTKKKTKQKGKVKKVLLTIFLVILVIGLLAAGLVGGIVYGILDEETNVNIEDLTIKFSNSKIVTADGTVELAELSGDEKRKIITLDQMSEYIPKAYVAIEDERFYSHHGVDIKRTASAIVYALMGNSSYGGSTITQQLVKNLYNDKEQTYTRKIREWVRAYKVEKILTKEEILEQYLNILFVGGQMHGVEMGAEYYFAKTAKELDLAESAFLAGINHMPNAYNPYDETLDNSELIKNRTLIVLDKMYELGYITSEEKAQADAEVNAGLVFQKMETPTNVYSYHTDAIIDQLTKQLMEERGYTQDQAETFIYSSGLTIYSCVDQNVQTALETELGKQTLVFSGNVYQNGVLVNSQTQAAMVVIDYTTGQVVGCVGGLGGNKTSRGLNRATQTLRQVGSAMKPIADVAPALQEKIIQASTIYDDNKATFTNGATPWTPKNYNRYRGLISIRQFIETSQNIPAAKIMAELTPSKSLEYLEKFGITSLDKEEDNVLALALGGQHNGVSVLDMAVAYGTIANGGLRISPTFYTKVVDQSGEVILEPNQEKEQAISPQNAYLVQQILRSPVYGTSGTATNCAISGIETSAKTGTTDDDCDRWLCGMTPYYSAACWFGYDINEEVKYSGTNPAGQIWSNAMKAIHANLASANFVQPEGIVSKTICTSTGLLAGPGCPTSTEMFTEDNIPDTCTGHGTQTICSTSNLIATPYCPSTYTRVYGTTAPKEKLGVEKGLWTPLSSSSSGTKITGTCNLHLTPSTPAVTTPSTADTPTNTNTTNTTTTTPSTNTTTNTNTATNTTTTTPNTNTTPDTSTVPSGGTE